MAVKGLFYATFSLYALIVLLCSETMFMMIHVPRLDTVFLYDKGFLCDPCQRLIGVAVGVETIDRTVRILLVKACDFLLMIAVLAGCLAVDGGDAGGDYRDMQLILERL